MLVDEQNSRCIPGPTVVLAKLLFDRIWESDPAFYNVLWPFLGASFPSFPDSILPYWWELFTSDTYVIVTESIGFVIFIAFVVGYKLYRLDNFKAFLKSGRLARGPRTNIEQNG